MPSQTASETPSVRRIFTGFLLVGATSFGGGVTGHLHSSTVERHEWLTDATFVRLLGISQTLPGLNATNLAILIGDYLRGARGALAAVLGVCLPGAVLMYVVGLVFQSERQRPFVEAGLDGVAAAAVGLIFATTLQLGQKSLSRIEDLVFIVVTVVCVNRLHMSVAWVLVAIGALAAGWFAFVGGEKGRSGP
jgi:chromate transporter